MQLILIVFSRGHVDIGREISTWPGLAVDRMAAGKMECPGGRIGVFAYVAQQAGVLQGKINLSAVSVPLSVGRSEEDGPPSIRIDIGPQGHVKIIIYDFIISQPFQADTGLIAGRELGWQHAGMPAL